MWAIVEKGREFGEGDLKGNLILSAMIPHGPSAAPPPNPRVAADGITLQIGWI